MTKAEMLECRSCLNTSENFYNLFDKYKCEYDFPKIINKLTGIQINEKDNLTKLICVDCFDQLVQIGKFQKRFVESNEKLHNKLNSLDESIKADKLEQIYHFDTIQHDVIIENEVSESIVLLQIESTNFNELIANHVVEEEYITNIEQQIVNAPPADEKCDNSANKSKNVKKSPTKQRSKTNDVQFEIVTSDKDALICKTCGKEFVSVRSRRVHEYVHKQGQFLCKHCPRILTTAGFLRVHMQNTHNVFVPKTVSTGHAEPLALTDCQCDICKKYFAADRIARHMKTHSRKSERPKCPICPQTFSCAKNIQRHLKKQHADDNSDKIPQFTCDTCSESFYRAVELYEHSKEHDSNCNETDTGYNLVCDVCEIKCETYEAYARHMIDNHNQTRIQPYKCRICSVRNGSKTGLYMHINCHYSNLLTSIATHTTLKIEPSPKNEKPFPCTYCDHRFRNARRLEEHTRVHTGEEPYECVECSKRFKTRMTLSKHIKSRHATVRDFLCSVCGKDFSTKAVLNEHMLLHTGERPFSCSHCNKKFTGMSRLREHTRVHTNERPYICLICNKAFRSHTNLRHHKISLHSDERKHMCSVCGKNFKFNSSLKTHMWTHSGDEKPYNCTKCKEGFMRLKKLKLHMVSCTV